MTDVGWHSRGYLPHFDSEDVPQHVTFHLADSLPHHVLESMERQINALPLEKQDLERRKKIEEWLDAGFGSCVLREPAVAEIVQAALLYFDGQRYCLMEWSIMPNHVHTLFQPINGWNLSDILASWKKYTARRILDFMRKNPGYNKKANREIDAPRKEANGVPRVWHREYRDRYIRNQVHFENVINYIRLNPVKAGLARIPEEWVWSSAYVRSR